MPPTARGQLLYQRGAIAYNARQFAQASQFFAQAKAAGYSGDNLDMLIVKAKIDGGDTAGGVAELNGVIDKATPPVRRHPRITIATRCRRIWRRRTMPGRSH